MADVDNFMKEAESYSWCLRSAHEQEERGNKWNGVFWRERAREHLIRAFGFGPDDLNSDALKAARLAYDQKTSDMTSVYPTEEPDAGEGPIGYAIRAYLRIYLDAMAWSEGEFTKPLYAHPAALDKPEAVETVGEAGEMPGSNGGFTMAVFKASDVPLGTKLYTRPADTDAAQSGGETPVAFERLIERGQAFANQVRHVTYRLNGQAYSTTVSELNAFDAALRRARAAIRQRAEEPTHE
ncbi:hypothetical protein [Sinorhizobium medicae]